MKLKRKMASEYLKAYIRIITGIFFKSFERNFKLLKEVIIEIELTSSIATHPAPANK